QHCITIQKPILITLCRPAGDAVKLRRIATPASIRLPNPFEHLGVEVLAACRHHVDDYHGDLLPEQPGALTDERTAMLRPVLVGRTDNLDGGHETATALRVENQP